jgi:cell division protein ZapA
MSKTTIPVTLIIMGKEYKIACDPAEQDNLINCATELDRQMRKMRDSGRIAGAERIAVVTALNLAHELQTLKNQRIETNPALSQNISELVKRIESVLENP